MLYKKQKNNFSAPLFPISEIHDILNFGSLLFFLKTCNIFWKRFALTCSKFRH